VPRVLVAEDNRVNQLVISKSLQNLGYAVDIAENGEIAVERCRTTTYAAILMDCQMPIMDGYEATAAIRKSGLSNWSIPIIAVTAHAMLGDEERCLAAGMTDYITKPISKGELIRALSPVTNVS
jgi:CheY-like chemotaxis protein